MKILFLYTELAEYFMSCLVTLAKREIDIHVVHFPINKEAPFRFSLSENIHTYERSDYNEKHLIEWSYKILPDIIYCSGWIDKAYLKVCKSFRNKIPVIVGFDNKWTGSIKQRSAALLAKQLIHANFSHCWIPGDSQLEFAYRLKFSDKHILSGLYSCDYTFFSDLHLKIQESKKIRFPHRMIYVGRYYTFKGVADLWKSFIEVQEKNPNDWELWCLGAGDVAPVIHPKIKHFGFIQPRDMERFIVETGVFVMPSHFEPWGVAVHEFSAAGFPLICSDEVGAAEIFLKDGMNGFVFQSGNISRLKITLEKIMSMSDKKLFQMGEKSAALAKQITPDKWSDTLMSVMQQ